MNRDRSSVFIEFGTLDNHFVRARRQIVERVLAILIRSRLALSDYFDRQIPNWDAICGVSDAALQPSRAGLGIHAGHESHRDYDGGCETWYSHGRNLLNHVRKRNLKARMDR